MDTGYTKRVAKSNERVTQGKIYKTFWATANRYNKSKKCYIKDDNGYRMQFSRDPKYWIPIQKKHAGLVGALDDQEKEARANGAFTSEELKEYNHTDANKSARYFKRVGISTDKVTHGIVYEAEVSENSKGIMHITFFVGLQKRTFVLHKDNCSKSWLEVTKEGVALSETKVDIYKDLADKIKLNTLATVYGGNVQHMINDYTDICRIDVMNCRCVGVKETKRECIDRQIDKVNQEYSMKIETGMTLIDDVRADTLKQYQLIEMIKETEFSIGVLREIKTSSETISRKIKAHEDNIKELVRLLDESVDE